MTDEANHQARRPLRHRASEVLSSPGGKSGDAGRAAADAYPKSCRRGNARRYHLRSENHRRRVRSAAPMLFTGPAKKPRPGVLRGTSLRDFAPRVKFSPARPPKRAFGSFSRVRKGTRPGGRNPRPLPRDAAASPVLQRYSGCGTNPRAVSCMVSRKPQIKASSRASRKPVRRCCAWWQSLVIRMRPPRARISRRRAGAG